MKTIAEQACYKLACLISIGLTEQWKRADKIERRWRIQGCTQATVDRLDREHADWLAEQSRKHDALNPDRLSYLHR